MKKCFFIFIFFTLIVLVNAQTATGFLSIKPSPTALGCGCTGCNDAAYIAGVTYPDAAGGCGTSEPSANSGGCAALSKEIIFLIPTACTVNITGCMTDRTSCAGSTHGPGLDGGDQFSIVGTGGVVNGNTGVITGASNSQSCASIVQVGGQVSFNLTANRVAELLTYTISYTGPACTPTILPVEFINFDVELKDELLLVEWATISEKNSESFEIEFSEDALHFTTLNKVIAQGESNSLKIYKKSIPDTFKTNKFYVRLKQNDKNGLYAYSPIVFVSTKEINNFKIMPNPTQNGIITLLANQKIPVDSYFELYDYTGKVILKEYIHSDKNPLNLEAFGSGIYLLQIHSANHSFFHKIVYQ